ncbi:histidine ammonia-lyase [bacterium]|nr:histidine ammonia-lyase [bacterium]
MKILKIDGSNLTIDKVSSIINDDGKLKITPGAKRKVIESEKTINKIVAKKGTVYGVNTGFGEFSSVSIPSSKLRELQENLIRSHCVGCGVVIDTKISKTMMLLRLNSLLKGHSGIRIETLNLMIELFNRNIIPVVFSKGSVGASGDLVPLAHMALPLLGEGEVHYKGKIQETSKVFKKEKLKALKLGPKEGLALINGTQYMSANAVLALLDIRTLINMAGITSSMTIEGYQGTLVPFDKRLHDLRPHPGQNVVSTHIRSLVKGSEIQDSHKECKRIQDPYSLRCIPQVHGAIFDTYIYVKSVVEREINSVTDNPIIFNDTCEALSGGNFHGEPLALVLDFIAMAVTEIGSISERRGELLLRAPQGTDLPMFLTEVGGLNSGLMIAQYAAASLVNHCKVLSHPACVDTIPTSADKEDHVSMGATSAIKLNEIIDNVFRIIAIELMISAQAIEFHRPLKTSIEIEKIMKIIRKEVKVLKRDRMLKPDIDILEKMVRDNMFSKFYSKEIK